MNRPTPSARPERPRTAGCKRDFSGQDMLNLDSPYPQSSTANRGKDDMTKVGLISQVAAEPYLSRDSFPRQFFFTRTRVTVDQYTEYRT